MKTIAKIHHSDGVIGKMTDKKQKSKGNTSTTQHPPRGEGRKWFSMQYKFTCNGIFLFRKRKRKGHLGNKDNLAQLQIYGKEYCPKQKTSISSWE